MDETITTEELHDLFIKYKRDTDAAVAIIEERLRRLENAENSNSQGQ